VTRTRAWRTLAIAFDTPIENKTARQKGLTAKGLCLGLLKLEETPRGYDQLVAISGSHDYWWGFDKEGQANRAVFAGLMAAMSQRERDKLVKGL
jgi:hypothetical protein